MKPALQGVPETMLLPLWARAYEGYRRHWGLLGLLSLIPWVNRNINNKILCLTLEKETHEKAAAAARRLP